MKRIAAILLATSLALTLSGFAEGTGAVNSGAKVDALVVKKVYAVYLGATSSYVLQDIEPVEFNGIKCLKGEHVNISWIKNKVVYIPVDKVSLIVEYNSVEEFKQTISTFQKGQMQME